MASIIGVAKEESTPVARTIRAYDRSSGLLVAQTTSDSVDGYFEITGLNAVEHYVVALDNDAGTSYNHLIFDRVIPE